MDSETTRDKVISDALVDIDEMISMIDGVLKSSEDEMLENIFGPECSRCGVRVRMPCSCPRHLRVWDFFLRRRPTIY